MLTSSLPVLFQSICRALLIFSFFTLNSSFIPSQPNTSFFREKEFKSTCISIYRDYCTVVLLNTSLRTIQKLNALNILMKRSVYMTQFSNILRKKKRSDDVTFNSQTSSFFFFSPFSPPSLTICKKEILIKNEGSFPTA